MKDGARLFAYTTWVIMISLAIIVFTNTFLVYVLDPGWIGLATLLGFGFLYLNFTYLAVKRYVRRVLGEGRLHWILALLILLPPAGWILILRDDVVESSPLILLVLAIACIMGTVYGKRAGKRDQQKHLERLQQMNREQN